MSTRSIIAVRDETGTGWRGRYCHSDGAPHHNGVQLLALVKRDGFDYAVKQLTGDHYMWGCLDADQPEDSVRSPRANNDGRFVSVPGYGTARTTRDGQTSPADWTTETRGAADAEWVYGLDRSGVTVLRVIERTWVEVGYVPFGDDGPQAMCGIGVWVYALISAHSLWAISEKGAPGGMPPLSLSADQLATTISRLHYYTEARRPLAVQILRTLVKDYGCSLTADEIDAVVGELDPPHPLADRDVAATVVVVGEHLPPEEGR